MKKRSLKEKSEENIPGGWRKFFKNKEDFIIKQKNILGKVKKVFQVSGSV